MMVRLELWILTVNEFCKYEPKDYLEHIAEHTEKWSYLKYPYLKNVGWKGLVDGKDSGVYLCNTTIEIECFGWYGNTLLLKLNMKNIMKR